jgi:glycerol uptake facilitator-like aquaporin
MMSYEEVDLFSQSINPLLALTALVGPWFAGRRVIMRRRAYFIGALSSVALAYLWWWSAKSSHQWEHAWGIVFSTHWAVHLAILSTLWQLRGRWRPAAIVIALAYALLIWARRYHTLTDMIATSIALLPTLGLLWWILSRYVGPISDARAVRGRG